MAREQILQTLAVTAELSAALAERYDVHPLWKEADPAAFVAQHGARFSGLATTAMAGASAAMLAALPMLRVVSSFGVGLDAIDLAAARTRGIAVGYTPDVLNDCVADLAFGALIDMARQLSAADRFVRRGDWLNGRYPLATRVSGKKLGIVGLGRIGRVIAHRASGFDMTVRYMNRRPVDDVHYGFEPSLIELARWADFLVIAAAGSARHLVDKSVLDALGPQGFLVNISRGQVIDEAVLVDALVRQRIAGAALDVFADEPRVPQALLALDNVVLLPHIASGTHETRRAMSELVLANLESFFSRGHVVASAIDDAPAAEKRSQTRTHEQSTDKATS